MKKLLPSILLIVICSSAFAQPFKAIREVNFKRAYIDSLIRVDYLAATSTGYSLVVYDSASKTFRQVPASTYSTGCGDSTGGGGTGSVTSVGISSPDITVTGTNPIVSSGTFTLTLPTVNAHAGTFGNSRKIPIITANAKGLVTNLDSVDISIVDATDTVTFTPIIDSTGQPFRRVLFAGQNGKIASDSVFLYAPSLNKLVVGTKNVNAGGNSTKFYLQGNFMANGTISKVGGAKNQFLKADGSIDTTHYVKSVSVNGTTFNVDTTTGNVDLGTISSGSGGSVTSVGLTSTDFDITGSPITSAGTFTANLKTVNSNIGTFNNVTVNAKGQVLAASNVSYLSSFTETDPIYSSLGVSLAGQQTLTGVKTFPASTTSNPSLIIPSGSAYAGTTTGAISVSSNHIWAYLNGTLTQLDNQLTSANAILNQYASTQAASFRIDTATSSKIRIGRFDYATMGAFNMDSTASRQGFYMYGDNNLRANTMRAFRMYWQSTDTTTFRIETSASNVKNITLSTGGTLTLQGGGIQMNGAVTVQNNITSPNATMGNWQFSSSGQNMTRASYPGCACTPSNGASNTIEAGDATANNTTVNDLQGGTLNLNGGIAYSNGGSTVVIKTATPTGSSGTVQVSPTTKLTVKGSGTINIAIIQNFADNTTAIAGGLVTGDVYRNGDNLMIVH